MKTTNDMIAAQKNIEKRGDQLLKENPKFGFRAFEIARNEVEPGWDIYDITAIAGPPEFAMGRYNG